MIADPSTLGALAEALSNAQGELRDPARNKAGQVRGRRDYRYAGLDDLLQTIRPVLSRHGLAITQTVQLSDGRVVLRTVLLHKAGGSIHSDYPLEWKGSPQDHGSEVTYARRYSLEAIVGVAPSEPEPEPDGVPDEPQAHPGPQGQQSPPPPSSSRPGAVREPTADGPRKPVATSGGGQDVRAEPTRWTKEQAADFRRRLDVMGLDYMVACDVVESTGRPRPGDMGSSAEGEARRAKLLRWLDGDSGRQAYAEVEPQRTEALDFARSLSTAERKVAAEAAGLPTTEPAKLSLLQLLSLIEHAPVDDAAAVGEG